MDGLPGGRRRFIQALIQAAVALYHSSRGNHAGAARLFRSGRRTWSRIRPAHRGLDVDAFWRQMEAHLAPALARHGDGTAGSATDRSPSIPHAEAVDD